MVMSGWEMGASESVAMVVTIGFSVDYVCHLAAHYVHSGEKLRYYRSTEAITDMGVSIFSSGITTLGSGFFLFGCTIIFFQKFAIVIVSTVLFSLAYALIYFQALCHVIGPQYHCGDFGYLRKKIYQRCKKYEKKDANDDNSPNSL